MVMYPQTNVYVDVCNNVELIVGGKTASSAPSVLRAIHKGTRAMRNITVSSFDPTKQNKNCCV